MPGIGETLREARMRQRIDISDVETATKIRAKYLRALENEEFSLLHGSTFVRSFLRTYAQYLGLDPQRLIEEYRAHHEPREEAELHPHVPPVPPRGRDRRRNAPRPPSRGLVVAGLAIALLGFLLVLGLTGDDEGGDGGGTPSAQTETSERPERERTETSERGSRERSERRTSRSRNVSVRVLPTEPTYACVDRGPGTDVVFEGTLEAPRTFRGRRIRLNIGRTSARVRINGRAFDTGSGSDPVGFDITRRRTRALATGQRPCA